MTLWGVVWYKLLVVFMFGGFTGLLVAAVCVVAREVDIKELLKAAREQIQWAHLDIFGYFDALAHGKADNAKEVMTSVSDHLYKALESVREAEGS